MASMAEAEDGLLAGRSAQRYDQQVATGPTVGEERDRSSRTRNGGLLRDCHDGVRKTALQPPGELSLLHSLNTLTIGMNEELERLGESNNLTTQKSTHMTPVILYPPVRQYLNKDHPGPGLSLPHDSARHGRWCKRNKLHCRNPKQIFEGGG
ncbi:hypothetical protein BJ508DRAFT_410238 [Ascobolus immersus RN42]|uniref:Uncharacterized protein n=1 Tax=Ascobolus immersus RN42 TaxID=1160509 RepID=A0A3N4IT91_ASCIM|nr:hypothetical protein BJ508DRAFT_410238 [Ascobolus immersus RN42]